MPMNITHRSKLGICDKKSSTKKTCNESTITAQKRIHMYTYYFYVHKKTQKLHIEVPQSFFGSYDFSISSNDETILFTAFSL